MVVSGGMGLEDKGPCGSVEFYDVAEDKWELMPPLASPRCGHTMSPSYKYREHYSPLPRGPAPPPPRGGKYVVLPAEFPSLSSARRAILHGI